MITAAAASTSTINSDGNGSQDGEKLGAPPMSVLDMTVSESVAVVTLNRPEARNALIPELIVRLARSWQAIRDDAGIRAVVLTGAPGSTFCAGFDLAKTIPLFTAARYRSPGETLARIDFSRW